MTRIDLQSFFKEKCIFHSYNCKYLYTFSDILLMYIVSAASLHLMVDHGREAAGKQDFQGAFPHRLKRPCTKHLCSFTSVLPRLPPHRNRHFLFLYLRRKLPPKKPNQNKKRVQLFLFFLVSPTMHYNTHCIIV